MDIPTLETIRDEYGVLHATARAVTRLAANVDDLRRGEPDFVIIEDELIEDLDLATGCLQRHGSERILSTAARQQVAKLKVVVERLYDARQPLEQWTVARELARAIVAANGAYLLLSRDEYEVIHYWSPKERGR